MLSDKYDTFPWVGSKFWPIKTLFWVLIKETDFTEVVFDHRAIHSNGSSLKMDRSTSLVLIFVILGNVSLAVKGKIVFGYLYSVVYGMIYTRLQRKCRFQCFLQTYRSCVFWLHVLTMALSRFINPTFNGESNSVSASFYGSLLVLWFISSGNYISLSTNTLGQRSNFGNTELLNWKIFRSWLSKGFFFLLFVSFM